ncbi:MAG TPA: hypothetical protein VEL07_22585 [Planctomycetota bacterium]|nr:hypothetical protein [Planctomycetota bacterium]
MPEPLSACLSRWRSIIVFPGRLRVVSDLAVPGVADGERAADMPGDLLLASACGLALAETPVGGRVLAVIARERLADAATLAALTTATRLGLANLALAISGGDDADERLLDVCGWRIAADLGGDGPVATRVGALPAAAPAPGARAPAPVRLASLGAWRDALRAEASPYADAGQWLADLATREPRLVLPHRDWPCRADAAGLAIAAEVAATGRRVAWLLPPRCDLSAALPALRAAARRRIALKLLMAAEDLPPLGAWSAAPGWWLIGPAGDAQLRACLAHALATEDATLIALPKRAFAGDWQGDHEAGSGRRLAVEAAPAATLVCDNRGIDLAVAARLLLGTAGIAADVLLCTSLAPLPAADLVDAAARGPLIAIDALAGAGFTDAVVAIAPRAARVVTVRSDVAHVLTPTDVAQAACTAVRASG